MAKNDEIDLTEIAVRLDHAALHAEPTQQSAVEISVEQAYAVQTAVLARRYQRGESRVGIKMGFTSRAKMVQMGVNEMIWGRLTDGMLVEEGGFIQFERFVHPRVEPEIAFLIARSLPDKVTPAGALACVEAVAPALEIIDSRYENFKFSLSDVIADNTSASGFVLGGWARPDQPIGNLGMILEIDGVERQIGSSAAIMGNPIRSLVAAAMVSHKAGEPLQPGDVVLAGGATAAEPLQRGQHVRVTVQRLGSAEFFVR